MISSNFHLANSDQAVLAVAIHNGHHLPEALIPYTPLSDAIRFREEDPYTGDIAGYFDNHVIVGTSRFAVDLNRDLQHAVYLKPEDAWGLNVRQPDLPESLLKALYESYTNWYSALSYQIDRILGRHPFLFVFDIHSYNHRRGGATAQPAPQSENPDIILGRSNMPQKLYPWVEKLRKRLDQQDFFGHPLDVRCDVKFSGGHLSRWLHDSYPDKLICIAVEFKKIFMDEHSGKLNPVSLARLRDIFGQESKAWLTDMS